MRIVNAIVGVIFGVCLSQFPEFSQQYEQRLGGAVDELAALIQTFDAAAARAGLDRQQALTRYDANADTFIVGQGADMRASFARYDRLSQHLAALKQAGPIDEVINFAQYFDTQIAARAWEAYQPAVPVTPTGLVFGGVGLVAGYGLAGLLLVPFRRRRRSRV